MPGTARDYKATLNLPKTAFAMKANLTQAEPATLAAWESAGLAARLMAGREGASPWVFHDGPPYANGSIHMGHLLNKVLKDLVVRSRIMDGHAVRYVPGWDCHGLPIEHKVATEVLKGPQAAKLEALPEATRRMAIRRECKAYAEKFIKLQASQMRRLLTIADYGDPYATMQPAFEGATLRVFADLVEQGLVFRQRKPVHWSIANRTALAEAELEYEERQDPAVWVEFEGRGLEEYERAFGATLDQVPTLMIWTTTPWTLPANHAVAVHPRMRYCVAKLGGSVTVLARPLLERVAKDLGAEAPQVLAEADGAALAGLTYAHPFIDRTSRVVLAEYVTAEDGTGLVHTAPGHGEDDYRTGLREGLPIDCPVREDGTYDDSAPAFLRGKSVWDANELVTQALRTSGHLAHSATITHPYPHDWRSKTPVIFRATEQWFVGVDRPMRRDGRTLRQAALSVTEREVAFIPEWGRNRMRGMLESRPDWCISRQRAWGLPIPAFALPDGSVLLTPASVRAVAEAVGARGSDAWFTEPPEALLAAYDPSTDADAPKGLAKAALSSLTKLSDIFDVWFEAGSSWAGVLRQRGIGFPAQMYLEGSDQHRGWFQLSLLLGLGAAGTSPFRSLLTHGFIVDKDGRKMSKSLGNTIEVEDILKEFGADVCRWWVSSVPYEGDIKADISFLKLAGESYRKVRNTLRFLLSNLEEGAGEGVDLRSIPGDSLDGWALGELARLEASVREAYRACDFRAVHLAIFDFCNDTLSSVYCAATKDRLYCERRDGPRRRQSQAVMRACAESLVRMLWPILPHTAEEAWKSLRGEGAPALGLAGWHETATVPHADWPEAMAARARCLKALEEAKGRGIENPLDAGLRVPDAEGRLSRFARDLADLCGVSRLELVAQADAVEVIDLRNEPRCERSWRRDGTVRQRSDGGMLSDRDAAAVGVD